ncbi:uncharacterized protein LOC117581692 [Drosophila guanche]|uniref:HSF-type DNA-binding domain-containing protein n=1 Tax=Drosophila guanche TaxID=7266 RepID=A0A3B0J656_DROGU|nr:uncharacterized protein LOC117581692 [Drosophila guanche]SPP75403.1 Hypothetical predicted protein [Drosophila guanche]
MTGDYQSNLHVDEVDGQEGTSGSEGADIDDWQKIFRNAPPTTAIGSAESGYTDPELKAFMDTLNVEDDADDVQEVPIPIDTIDVDDEIDIVFDNTIKRLSQKKQKQAASPLQQKPKVKKRILRKRLAEYSFLQMLYLAANSPCIDFLHWSKDKLCIIVLYVALQEHLISSRSMFRCRSVLQFATELSRYGFERVFDVDCKDAAKGTIVLVFQHPNFVMGAPHKIRKISYENMQEGQENAQTFAAGHQQRDKDICTAFHSYLSPLQVARCRLHTELSYHCDMALLHECANESNRPVAKRAGRPAPILEMTVEQQLAGRTDKFVNPYESVTKILTKQVPSYAGYYGNVPHPKLEDFFQQYMPRYGIKISGYKQIVIDGHNKSSDFNQNIPIGNDDSDDENDEPAKRDVFDLEEVMNQLCDEDAIASEDDVELLKDSVELLLNEDDGTYTYIKKAKEEQKPLPKLILPQKATKKRQQEDDQRKGKRPLPKKLKKCLVQAEIEDDTTDTDDTDTDADADAETGQQSVEPSLQNVIQEDVLMDFAGDDDDDEYIDKKVLRRTARLSASKRRSYELRKVKRGSKKK